VVRGLDTFRRHFQGFEDYYVLIGGSAAAIVSEVAGIEFRSTKDLDIVLCIEAIDSLFADRFWQFIKTGNYETRQRSADKRTLYRFHSPQDQRYPYMIELFSRLPDILDKHINSNTLTPIPINEDISSLSAIILESDYYELTCQYKRVIDGISVIGPEALIPLKAKAWINLTNKRQQGTHVDSKDIKKHRNDIFRLFPLLRVHTSVQCSEYIVQDINHFCMSIRKELHPDIRTFGIRTLTVQEVLSRLENMYHI
jgi:hypothetical protein